MSAQEGTILTAEQEELISSRLEAATEEVQKILDLIPSVIQDPSSRLPHLPVFYRTMKPQEETEYLNKHIPKLQEARQEEFCLSACDKEGKDCMSVCREFTKRAFGFGHSLYAGVHKPYFYTKVQAEVDDE